MNCLYLVMQDMDRASTLSTCGRLLNQFTQPKVARLVVEPAMPKHSGADSRGCKGKLADGEAV